MQSPANCTGDGMHIMVKPHIPLPHSCSPRKPLLSVLYTLVEKNEKMLPVCFSLSFQNYAVIIIHTYLHTLFCIFLFKMYFSISSCVDLPHYFQWHAIIGMQHDLPNQSLIIRPFVSRIFCCYQQCFLEAFLLGVS